MLRRADAVITCGARPDPAEGMGGVVEAMNLRNHLMVNHADLVFGICRGNPMDGSCKGGTKECLAYAAAMKKEIFLLDPFTLEGQYVFRNGEWLDI